MATPTPWTDRRSGPLGRAAGAIALADVARSQGRIVRRKGTTFLSHSAILTARACGSVQYLVPPEVHWSTFGPQQHRAADQEARRTKRRLHYLFVTGAADAVSYWLVPGELVADALAGIRPRASDGL